MIGLEQHLLDLKSIYISLFVVVSDSPIKIFHFFVVVFVFVSRLKVTVGKKSHLITFFITIPFIDLNLIKMNITIGSMRK